MSFDFNKKLEEKVRQDLAHIINYELSDPRLGMVSVTRVELLQQCQFGTVYYSVLGDEKERRKVQAALEHARGHIQGKLGKRLTTRHTPKLTFSFDPGLGQSIRISALFNQLEEERAEAEASAQAQAELADGEESQDE